MGNKNNRHKGKRLLKAIGIGLATGALTFCAFVTPPLVRAFLEQKAAAVQQSNLLSARGEAYDSFEMANVSVTALLGGQPREGISLYYGQGFWEVPASGEMNLQLAPGRYSMTAGYQNRILRMVVYILSGQENPIVFEVDKAPRSPDWWIEELTEATGLIPLDIENADEVSVEAGPDGVSVVKRDGVYYLSVNDTIALAGFSFVKLKAQNEYGEASSFIGLRSDRSQPVTEIHTVEDLDAVRNNLSGNYRLKNDLDLSGIDGWRAIGSDANPFTGVLDGGGHEITGLNTKWLEEDTYYGLFGVVKNAELRNIIIREPDITAAVPERSLANGYMFATLTSRMVDSLVEDCASIGGTVSPSDGLIGGLISMCTGGIIRGCYNSTRVFCSTTNGYLPNTGGIAGETSGAVVACTNEGEVKGNHLAGGIAGFSAEGYITRCINSGYVWGSTVVGAIPPGGIIQSMEVGGVVSSCYFVRGQSPVGANSGSGLVTAVKPIDPDDLRSPEALPMLGSFSENLPEWAYASLDAQGPVPVGIFKTQADSPIVNQNGSAIEIKAMEGVQYFYTLDGSNPYTSGAVPVEQLNITLKQGEILRVFAARQGSRDSEILMIGGVA